MIHDRVTPAADPACTGTSGAPPPAQGSFRPSPLEIASGTVLGAAATVGTEPCGDAGSPLEALEHAALPALLRPPCLVSFSGGMDSSFVLAVATRAARRHGLPAPVPISWHFTAAPSAAESSWQKRVLTELGLVERVVLQAGDDLDFLGPVAARLLHRYGVLYPANLHLHVPLLEQAAGGSLLTGFGGDQLLSSWAATSPTPAGRLRRALPDELRIRLRQLRGRDPYRWLRRPVSRDLSRRRTAESTARPAHPLDRLAWQAGRRELNMSRHNLNGIGAALDVTVVHPLLDNRFHTALGRTIGPTTPLGRAQLLARIAGNELPPSASQHRAKARFHQVYLREHTRGFLQNWPGAGIPDSFVDPAALRSEWASWPFTTATALLLQQVWLNQQ